MRRTVVLYDGDDFEKLADARMRVDIALRTEALAEEDAGRSVSRRMGDAEPDALAAARESTQREKDAYDRLVDEAAERAEEWVVQSIGFEAWRDLVAAHPARKVDAEDGKQVDHIEDAPFGLNTDTFGKALLLYVDPEDSDHRTVGKAGDVSLGSLPQRLKRLSVGQYETLWMTAYGLNTGQVADPKASRYSVETRSPES